MTTRRQNPFGWGRPAKSDKADVRVTAERRRRLKAAVSRYQRAWENAQRHYVDWEERWQDAETLDQRRRALTQINAWRRRKDTARRNYDRAFADAKRLGAL